MPPPVEPWPSRELPDRVMGGTQGNYRKGFDGDLKKCELMELVQYRCEVDRPEVRNSPVRCWPVVRLFRRCKDGKGSFMVETTDWKGEGR